MRDSSGSVAELDASGGYRRSRRRRFRYLVFTLSTVAAAIVADSTLLLYRSQLVSESRVLRALAHTQRALIESAARHEAVQGRPLDLAAALEGTAATRETMIGMGESLEYVIAQRQGGKLTSLAHGRSSTGQLTVQLGMDIAQPLRLATPNTSGVLIARDRRKVQVLAAYEIEPGLGIEVVVKKDLAEIRAPFLRAGVITIGIAVVIVLVGGLVYHRKTDPLIREVEKSDRYVRAVLNHIVDGIMTITPQGLIRDVNPAVEKLFGYQQQELLGREISNLIVAPGCAFRELMHTGVGGVAPPREIQGLARDGSTFPAELLLTRVGTEDHQFYVAMVSDIRERKRMERMKSELVSTVSHELRTPLTSIRGSLGLIAGGIAGELPAQAASLLNIALANCKRLVNLTNDILDLEKAASGKMEFHSQAVDLAQVVGQSIQLNTAYAQQFGVSYQVAGNLPALFVLADRDRLMQVMTNLLSNAAKFSPRGESVEVSVSDAGRVGRVTVTDHGPGIPAAFHDRVFERFSQADSSDTRQKSGTGLGLSIVKAFVEKMGGGVGFRTELGRGTSFFVDLPQLDVTLARVYEPSRVRGDWRSEVAEIQSVFGRMVHLAALRGESLLSPPDTQDGLEIARLHSQAFLQFLSMALDDQKADLDLHLLSNHHPAGGGAEVLSQAARLIPDDALLPARALFLSDLNALRLLYLPDAAPTGSAAGRATLCRPDILEPQGTRG